VVKNFIKNFGHILHFHQIGNNTVFVNSGNLSLKLLLLEKIMLLPQFHQFLVKIRELQNFSDFSASLALSGCLTWD